MNAVNVAKKAIASLNKRITDEVFLTIQNDRDLMDDYMKAVQGSSAHTVNREIGKYVKKAYGLTNDGVEKNPSSTLIKSHHKFK